MDKWFQRIGQKIDSEGVFVGCPLEHFESTSRDLFCLALDEGLLPWHNVLEIGCGCLRSGFWFLNYLEAGRYHGIEPNHEMIRAGVRYLLGGKIGTKMPAFTQTLEMLEQGVGYHFFLAFSVWSHAPKRMIEAQLDEFLKRTTGNAKFITSFFPVQKPERDYKGDEWVGRSHESDTPGTIGHSRDWVLKACKDRGLRCRGIDRKTLGQRWVVIERA